MDEGSSVETFVAAHVSIEGSRWRGVPFYLRTGKRLKRTATEIVVWLKEGPAGLFDTSEPSTSAANHLHIATNPRDGLSFAFHTKQPGAGFVPRTVKMQYSDGDPSGRTAREAYERLLLDAMVGDHTLFPREDEVERSWDIVDPILELPGSPTPYPAGSWGPPEADRLIAPRAWHLRGLGMPGAEKGSERAVPSARSGGTRAKSDSRRSARVA